MHRTLIGLFLLTAGTSCREPQVVFGVAAIDRCEDDDEKTAQGECGCGLRDIDTDDDGTPDCLDECPLNPEKTKPDSCGCGVTENVECDASGLCTGDDVTGDTDVFTFDFESPGASMYLDYDGVSVRIHGTAFGGLDIGEWYDPAWSSLVAIDVTYAVVESAPAS